jgi:site-specific recombinase XerD
MAAQPFTREEIDRRIAAIEFKPQHTAACREKNGYGRWTVPDRRKTCIGCKLSACGVIFDQFDRVATEETVEAKAKEVVRGWYREFNSEVNGPRNEASPSAAVRDYLDYVAEEATESTVIKYRTFLDQFVAFCEWRKIQYIRQVDQDYVLEFRATLQDPEAAYKKTNLKANGQPRWTTISIDTIRRNARILKSLFDRCIVSKWMTENPATILKMRRRRNAKRTKDEVKYLTRRQMEDILWAVDQFPRMTDKNKIRLKALILTMRWTGLRISDATVLKASAIRNGVLFLKTQKAKTDVQIPLPEELTTILDKMTPYSGGYLFWNRRKEDASKETPRVNFGVLIKSVFKTAGIEETDVQLISHRFRNTFAVHLLTKGVPLETVSLMLGHDSIGTTADYYAAYAHSYMDRAERLVRKVWTLKDDETLEGR